MFETNEYSKEAPPSLPVSVLRHFDELRRAVTSHSVIVWGEHCSECGFPTCYSTCSFYTPRKDDLNCGRFAKGIQQSRVGTFRLATIRFRKWGKLWGRGPAGLVAPEAAARREWIADLVTDAILKWVPSIVLRRAEWQANNWKLRQSARNLGRADAFIIEAWVPEHYSGFSFTLTIIPSDDPNAGLFQSRFDFAPGYNRRVVPEIDISSRVDLSAPYQIQIEPFEDSIGRDITFGLTEFVTLRHAVDEIRPASVSSAPAPDQAPAAKAKCVVWDLDNTVWRGTLAEDGLEGLTLNPAVRPIIEELDRRGILQSVASKNDPEPALAALEFFGLKDYLLYPQIGWGPKSNAIERIAALLDIGLDTFIFIDDQPFERGEVGESLPQVTVRSDDELSILLADPRLDVPITPESAGRRSMYQAEQSRKLMFEATAGDYVQFLRGCEIIVDAFDLSSELIERAYELSQRTNQLNVSGRRYSRDELIALQAPESSTAVYLFSCRDRFGEYGTIAMCVFNHDQAQIESFMMSCRVQRKRVEQAIFSWLTRRCRNAGFNSLSVQYRKTDRNDASVRMLDELGFSYQATEGPNAGLFSLPTHAQIREDDVVSLRDKTLSSQCEDVTKTDYRG